MNRSTLKAQLQEDGIEYLLVQFVDIHGSPKVKMVPAGCLDDVADVRGRLRGRGRLGHGPERLRPTT